MTTERDEEGDDEAAPTERAVDLALRFAHARFGLGLAEGSPAWVRGRVLAMLQTRADKRGVPIEQVAGDLEGEPDAVGELEHALRVGETRFYRDPIQWQAIDQHVLKNFPIRSTINVLCAGCSTGEEAYTAAMVLRSARRKFRVIGVDRSAPAIAVARKGIYGADAIHHLPGPFITRYCDVDGDILRVRDVAGEFVSFRQCDLVQQEIPTGPFHIIFFKNVLLYLPEPKGELVASRLIAELDDGGLLFPAASEVLRLRSAGLTPVRVTPGVTAFRKGA